MINVHIFDFYGTQFWRSSLFNWYPIHQNIRRFAQHTISFKFFSKDTDKLWNCDVLFIASSHFMWNQISHEHLLRFLEKARKAIPRIIWFDCEDSSGNTQFYVLPYIDRYLKKQLVKDRFFYTKECFFHNIASDFIHRRFNPIDSYWIDKPAYVALSPSDYHKVGISWNLGAYPTRCGAPKSTTYWKSVGMDFIERHFNFPHYLKAIPPRNNRSIDLIGLFGLNFPSETIAYQRKLAISMLEHRKKDTVLIGSFKIPRQKYWHYLRSSKVVISLWGWGEVCVREMEGFISGAAVIMPSMDHIETWPALYYPGKTYVPIKWDLSDLNISIDTLLENDEKRIEIATNGQKNYIDIWSEHEKERFVQRMISEITNA